MSSQEIACPYLRLSSGQIEAVKWLAAGSMLLDHAGKALGWPVWTWLLVGRLAWPLFAVLLASGALRSRNPQRVLFRLLAFSVIAQVPYSLLFGHDHLNVLVTLSAGWAVVTVWRQQVSPLWLFLPLAVAFGLPVDYGPAGVLCVVASAVWLARPVVVTLTSFLALLWCSEATSWLLSLPAFAAVFGLRHLSVHLPLVGRSAWWAWYGFYPVHLAFLALLVPLQ